MDKTLEKNPSLSVVMSVYNADRYLRRTIESILAQTFEDYELIIINDGSTDKSEQVIKGFTDPRIRLISRQNKGIVYSANQGVKEARADFIARHDADDISLPQRFERQMAIIRSDPKLGLIGSNYIIIDTKDKELDRTNVFTHPDDLKLAMVTCSQHANGSTIMRKQAIERAGMYKEGRVEDYDLFTRISRDYKVANVIEPLYKWRRSQDSYTFADHQAQLDAARDVFEREFDYFMKHKRQYKLLSYHPNDRSYRYRKSLILSNLAYMYMERGKTLNAFKMQLLACLIAPRVARNRQHLRYVLDSKWKEKWDYFGL
jgi:glycosyltransferase involved in cell wall biosynthesis